MISITKKNKIYKAVMDGVKLTKILLTSYDITDEEIEGLIDMNFLEETGTERYRLTEVKDLIAYSMKLVNKEEYDRAIECLELCLELNPTDREATLNLLTIYIRTKKYQQAFEIFTILDDTEDVSLQKDNNLYLYLLSIIYNYPEEYRERVIKMQYDDVVLMSTDNSGYLDIPNHNKMRISILQNKFSPALTIFNDNLTNDVQNPIEKSLIRLLLTRAAEIEKRKVTALLNYAEYENYTGIISLIEKQRTRGKVSLYYSFIYYLAKKIMIIKNTKTIPKPKVNDAESLKEALLGDNYELALKLNRIRAQQVSDDEEKNIVTILLKQINALINKLKQEEVTRQALFNNITSLLAQNEEQEALKLIEEYLKSIKKTEYQFIVLNLIKINSLEGNQNFSSVTTFLTNLSNHSYKFNVEDYIERFNDSITQNNFEVAASYLDIISKSISLSTENIEELKQKISSLSATLEQNIQERNLLLGYLDIIKDAVDPTIILPGIDKKQRHRIMGIVESIPELSISYTRNRGQKSLILRYIETSENPEDEIKLSNEGLKAYLEGNYQLSIDIHTKLLKTVKSVKPKLYTILGLSYYHQGNTELAIKYLTIANGFNDRHKNKTSEFNEVIACLNETPNEDGLERITSFVENFNSSLNNYDTNQLEEIAYYIKENNISLEEATISFRLTEEQINIIKLIYVRDYYTLADYPNGDALYKEVERLKQKSPRVISMLNEIKTNRKFYRNRVNQHKKTLSTNN